MADISTVVTSFPTDYATLGGVTANTPFANSYGAVTVASGALNVQCANNFNNGGKTLENFTWNGTGFYFRPTGAPKGGSATEMHSYYAIYDTSSTDDSIRMEWDIDRAPATPTITAQLYSTNATYVDVSGAVSTTYALAGAHAWLGWYYDATNVYFVNSSDGQTWSTFRSVPLSLATWLTTQSDLGFVLSTTRTGGTTTNALLDDVNTNGVTPGIPGARTPQPTQGFPSNPVLRSFTW